MAYDGVAEVWTCTSSEVDGLLRAWRGRSVLSAAELARVARLVPARARRMAFCSLLLRRLVLAALTGTHPGLLTFTAGAYGRPELLVNPWRIRFNSTHTAGLLACVVTGDRVCGIDAEPRLANPEALRYGLREFAPGEQTELRALDPAARAARFVDLWVLKEAYTKALGLGMQHPFAGFEFHVDGDRITLADPTTTAEDWDFRLTTPAHLPEHRLGLALRRTAGDPTPLPVRFRAVSDALDFGPERGGGPAPPHPSQVVDSVPARV